MATGIQKGDTTSKTADTEAAGSNGNQRKQAPADRNTAPLKGESEGGVLDDPSIAQTIAEDPLFQLIAKHWNTMLIGGLIAFGAWYMYQRSQQDYLHAMRSSSMVVAELRSAMTDYEQQLAEKSTETAADKVTALDKELSESLNLIQAKIAALKAERAPYPLIGEAYEALLAVNKGDYAQADRLLNAGQWEAVSKDSYQERFYLEIPSFFIARKLLDSKEYVAQGRKALLDLSKRGVVVNIAAAVTLAEIATTTEEKEEAAALLNELRASHPEQEDLLKDALSKVAAQEVA